jgi:hypothetical protein
MVSGIGNDVRLFNPEVRMAMKPFDLQHAIAGDPLITRDGRNARMIALVPTCAPERRVIAIIEGADRVSDYTETGCRIHEGYADSEDLFTAPKKRTVYVNLYEKRHGRGEAFYHDTEEHARIYRDDSRVVIAVAVPIEIEE